MADKTSGARGMQLLRRRVAAGVVGVIVITLLLLAGFRWARAGSLPGIEVAGVDVGALSETELDQRLAEVAETRAAEPIEVVREPVADADAYSETFRRSMLGYSLGVTETRERVLERGRQANPLAALADQIRASFTTIEVETVETVDPDELEEWAADVADSFEVTPRDGDLRFRGGSVRAVMPRPGAVVEQGALEAEARRTVLRDGPQELEVPLTEVEPDMTPAAVREAATQAREILAGPVSIVRGESKIRLTPRHLSRMVTTDMEETSDGTELELSVDPERLEEVAGDRLGKLERAPKDAGFTLSDGSVEIVQGQPGFELDHEKLAERLLGIARSDDRRGRAPGTHKSPEFSTKDARRLNIDEQVSTFTTEHSCCQPRVENIHRIADMLDGTVVKPGETFSVNDAVGERTRQKGFVPAPAIYEGEYVDEVGGGISQFATTLYNAIFFGGYELVDYKAHSYYISRYPAGREATLAYPSVDLAFRNDSDAGVYIDTSYTDTSITVTFYGNTDLEVEATSGEPHNYKDPPTQCEENRSLAKGERRVIQEGTRGFDIVVYRVFTNSDRERERFFTRYLPEPRIVERRSCG